MSSISSRVGRLVPRLGLRLAAAQVHRVPCHLVRMVEVQQINQIRRLSLSISSYNLQSQVQELQEVSPNDSKENILEKKLQRIDLDIRNQGRIFPWSLVTVINMLEKSRICNTTQALMILRCYGVLSVDSPKAERQKNLEEIIPFLKSIVKFDVSHYNAILKCYLDNGAHTVDISAFLAGMEADDVAPNRVTYQSIIGLYCLNGNIEAATTVLQQMKMEGMPITDTVFEFLVYGHCHNKDMASVKETQEIMTSTGLPPGAQTYVQMCVALAKAKEWEKVKEVMAEAKEKDVRLDCGDYMRIVQALSESGLTVEAETIYASVPKRAGFMQEMRNNLPQLVFAGNLQLAKNIFVSTNEDVKKMRGGDFRESPHFALTLAKSDVDPKLAVELLLSLNENNQNTSLIPYIIGLIENKKEENLKVLKEKIDESSIRLHPEGNERMFRSFLILQVSKGNSEIEYTLQKMKEFGLIREQNYNFVISELLRTQFDSTEQLPSTILRQIKTEIPSLPFNNLLNQMVKEFLLKEDLYNLLECNGFLLNTRTPRLRPYIFAKSMIDAALQTGNLSNIINIIFIFNCNMKEANGAETLYRSLSGLANTPKLAELLKELNDNKIGIMRSVADNLKEEVESEEVKAMFDRAASDFENPDLWTTETIEKFLEERRKVNNKMLKEAGFTRRRRQDLQMRNDLEIPEDLTEMENMRTNLTKQGQVSLKLIDSIIQAYALDNKPNEAVNEMERTKKKLTFQPSPISVKSIVDSFLRLNDPDAALSFIQKETDKFFFNTYIDICKTYARQGDHDRVKELLLNPPEDKEMINRYFSDYNRLIEVYAESGDINKLKEIINILKTNKRSSYQLNASVIRILLEKDNLPAAMQLFETTANEERVSVARLDLMKRLVKEENVEDLQKVTDICIKKIGEVRTLYELTRVFLEEGRKAQARKMLETPGLLYDVKVVSEICNYFLSNQRSDCLEDFVKFSRKIFGCDREFLYFTWVEAETSNPEKLNHIWLDMQEEGFVPSVQLKTRIAQILTAANLTVPFDTEGLELEEQKTLSKKDTKAPKEDSPKKDASKKDAPKKDAPKKDAPKKDAPKKEAPEEKVDLEVLELRKSCDELMDADKLNEAAELIAQKGYPRSVDRQTKTLLRKLKQKGEGDLALKFYNEMPREVRIRIKMRDSVLSDPKMFVGNIRNAKIGDTHMYNLSPTFIERVIEKNETVLSELESLSSSGCLPATIVLARRASASMNTEDLVRYWNMDTRDPSIKSRDMVCVNNLDSVRWIFKTLNEDSSVLERATNACMRLSEECEKVITFALDNGLPLDKISNENLRKVLKHVDNSPHKKEIEDVLKQRKEQTERRKEDSKDE